MYVRLAFAVAAHLDPEILIVDEVLAVGDADFQKKCIGKMQAVSQQEGRTILFVSHNMAAITRLCSQSILLNAGYLLHYDTTSKVIGTYLKSGIGASSLRIWNDPATAPQNDVVRLLSVRIINGCEDANDAVNINEPIGVEVVFDVLKEDNILLPNIGVYNEERLLLFLCHDTDKQWRRRARFVGTYTSTMWIPGNFFAEGTFVLDVALTTHTPFLKVHTYEAEVVSFQIVDNFEGNSARGDYMGPYPGLIRPVFEWRTLYKSSESANN